MSQRLKEYQESQRNATMGRAVDVLSPFADLLSKGEIVEVSRIKTQLRSRGLSKDISTKQYISELAKSQGVVYVSDLKANNLALLPENEVKSYFDYKKAEMLDTWGTLFALVAIFVSFALYLVGSLSNEPVITYTSYGFVTFFLFFKLYTYIRVQSLQGSVKGWTYYGVSGEGFDEVY